MQTITLYHIQRYSDASYYVDETYRIHTQVDLCVPDNMKLNGTALSTPFIKWFEDKICSVMTQHMGDEMISKWAAPITDPYHVTIAIGVNGHLVYPDLLCNTTSYLDSPLKHKQVVYKILEAIKQKEPKRPMKPLVFSPEWEQDAYARFFRKHHAVITSPVANP